MDRGVREQGEEEENGMSLDIIRGDAESENPEIPESLQRERALPEEILAPGPAECSLRRQTLFPSRPHLEAASPQPEAARKH